MFPFVSLPFFFPLTHYPIYSASRFCIYITASRFISYPFTLLCFQYLFC